MTFEVQIQRLVVDRFTVQADSKEDVRRIFHSEGGSGLRKRAQQIYCRDERETFLLSISKVEKASAAIDAVFSDTLVSQDQTLDDLRDLRDDIVVKISCLESDKRRATR